ncbi:COP9 signalosome complex subunit 3 [Aspergillus taichungensis]|uniref:COP9 signalosome complex subunit 3 n=1 Tax=Aspergillus taichungensis TaxID=482145 RepID=A0A2J5HK69_9EURO|nr:COP9 signalosome complex subunit 3 [Aspergillus taichungensis]
MAEILTRLTSLPARSQSPHGVHNEKYDSQIRDLISYLKQPAKPSEIGNASQYLLDNLVPSEHSLSYLYVLNYRIQSIQNSTKNILPDDILPGGYSWERAVLFLQQFDPIQMRYAGQEWRNLVHLVSQAALAVSKPLLAVQIIKDCILKMDPHSRVFTSIHLVLVRLCLLSKSYGHALPVLDRQIYLFPTITGQAYQKHHRHMPCAVHESSDAFIIDDSEFSSKLTYRDCLQYLLYGSMIYMALKQWSKAQYCLSMVMASPVTNSVSKIMVEAYKKWILVSLLGHGRLTPEPGIIASHVTRIYQSLTKPYASVAEAFERGDYRGLIAEIEIAQSVWCMDNNLGLVSQVIRAFPGFMVTKLGKTFCALTMQDAAYRVSGCLPSQEIEQFVACTIMSNMLDAVLLHPPNNNGHTMLRLAHGAKSRLSQERRVQCQLISVDQSFHVLANTVDQSNIELDLGNDHFQFLQKSQRWVDHAGKIGRGFPAGNVNAADTDEDIMSDLH